MNEIEDVDCYNVRTERRYRRASDITKAVASANYQRKYGNKEERWCMGCGTRLSSIKGGRLRCDACAKASHAQAIAIYNKLHPSVRDKRYCPCGAEVVGKAKFCAPCGVKKRFESIAKWHSTNYQKPCVVALGKGLYLAGIRKKAIKTTDQIIWARRYKNFPSARSAISKVRDVYPDATWIEIDK